jgi:hypothetical protein
MTEKKLKEKPSKAPRLPPDTDELNKRIEKGKEELLTSTPIGEKADLTDETTEEKEPPEKPEPEITPESRMPNVKDNFKLLLMRNALKEGEARQVTDYVSIMGSPRVFEDPVELLSKLEQFPYIIVPSLRKLILDMWVTMYNLPVSEEYIKKSTKAVNEERGMADKDPEAKFTVTIDGDIIVAEGAKLTRSEAEATASQIRKRKQEEANAGNKNDKEDVFSFDEMGGIHIVPGAKLSSQDFMMYQMVEKMKQMGDTRSALQIIQEQQALDDIRGIKRDGGSSDTSKEMLNLVMENNKLQIAQITTTMTTTMTEAIKGMTAAVEKMGTKTEDPMVAEMRKQNDLLRQQVETEREARHKAELEHRDNEAKDLKARVDELAKRQPAGAKDVLDVASEIGTAAVGELKGIRSDIPAILTTIHNFRQPVKPTTEGQKQILDLSKAAIKDSLKTEIDPAKTAQLKEMAKEAGIL